MTDFTDAICRSEDPELWFPVGTVGPALAQRNAARMLCQTECPLMWECRERAYLLGATDGVWGGLDFATERAHLPGAARPRFDHDAITAPVAG